MAMAPQARNQEKRSFLKFYRYTQVYLCIMATVVAIILLKGFGII